jgi:hypothetical protein
VLSLLALLIFGIIDFGSIYNDYRGSGTASADATRDAVVTNFGSVSSCGTTVTDTAVVNIICRVKAKAGLGNEVRVGVWAPGNWTPGATCGCCAQAAAKAPSGMMGPFVNGAP